MARVTKLIDDLDKTSEASQTLTFAVQSEETGKLIEIEIDLNDANYDKYNEILNLLAANGREVVREPVKAKRSQSPKKAGVKGKTQEMREWLRSQGHNVSDRGRVPQPLVDLYETRSRMPEKAVEAPKDEPKGEDTSEALPDADKANEEAVIARVKNTAPKTSKPRASRKAFGKNVDIPAVREVLNLDGSE